MGWECDQQILRYLLLILAKQKKLENDVAAINIAGLQQQISDLHDAVVTFGAANAACCEKTQATLAQILKYEIPPPAVSFTAVITINNQKTGGSVMSKPGSLKATADLQVNDATGQFTVTLAFKDADGVTTAVPAGLSASYVASDSTPGPSALNLTPSADTSSCAGAVNQTTIAALVAAGTALPTGLTITVTATWTGLASPQSVVAAPPIDVVAGPASTFVAAEA